MKSKNEKLGVSYLKSVNCIIRISVGVLVGAIFTVTYLPESDVLSVHGLNNQQEMNKVKSSNILNRSDIAFVKERTVSAVFNKKGKYKSQPQQFNQEKQKTITHDPRDVPGLSKETLPNISRKSAIVNKTVDRSYAKEISDGTSSAVITNIRKFGYQLLGTMKQPGDDEVEEDVRKIIDNANLGEEQAQLLLGLMYYLGIGMDSDMAKAIEWLMESADQGNIESQYQLGVIYDEGHGVSQDLVVACDWFKKAAEGGHPDAQFNLGMAYYDGDGVERNQELAEYWLNAAEKKGYPNVLIKLRKVIDE